MEQFWVWIRLSPVSEQRIRAIQDAVEPAVPATFSAETDVHVSVLPGVTIPTDVTDEFQERISETTLSNDTISFTGIDWYPSQHPYVITLGVDLYLEDVRTHLLDVVENLGGAVKHEPVAPHVTLFKSGDSTASEQITDSETLAELRDRARRITMDESLPTHWEDDEFCLEVDSYR